MSCLITLLSCLGRGLPLYSLFHTRSSTTRTTSGCLVVHVYGAALFTNWPSFRRRLAAAPAGVTGVIVDLSDAPIVDHLVRTQLLQLKKDWAVQRRALEIIGLAP